MRELKAYSFENGTFPTDWLVETNHHTFERGALRSGPATQAKIPLPGNGWDALRIEAEVTPLDGAVVEAGWDRFGGLVSVKTDLTPRHLVRASTRGSLAESSRPVAEKHGPCVVAFEFTREKIRALGHDQVLVEADMPTKVDPFFGLVQVGFWDDCLVHAVRIYGEGERAEPVYDVPAKKVDDFFLEVAVDYNMDLGHAAYTPDMFDQLFREFKSWGVRRCHWIYWGGTKHGLWTSGPDGVREAAAKTVAASGEIFPAAVRAAHAHGIEVYGLIKPFDMGFWMSLAEGSPEAAARGKAPRIGGPISRIADFPARHPEYLMARKPGAWGDAENASFTRIDLVKEDDGPCDFGSTDIELYASDDNATYRRVEGAKVEETVEDYPLWEHTASGGRPTGRTRRARVFRLTGFDLSSKYLAVTTKGRRRSFYNRFIDLIHVFGDKGEERRVSYALAARHGPGRARGGESIAEATDFRESGAEFDVVPGGTPTSASPGYDAISADHAFDSGQGFIAIARGKERGTVGALSPSFPEVRAWWLEWVRDCLEAGADGIELRVRNHHNPFAWNEFGFEPPVVEAFRERYGVDLNATDDFDKEAWRRLRGEAYTQFYREARALTREYGKSLGLHVSATMNMEPAEGAAMGIHWHWRTWLKEGLADSVTLKEVWPGTRQEQEIQSYARPRGIPTIFSPYANTLWKTPGGERIVAHRIRAAKAAGHDGFQHYECAFVIRGQADGRVVMDQPALREVFRSFFVE